MMNILKEKYSANCTTCNGLAQGSIGTSILEFEKRVQDNSIDKFLIILPLQNRFGDKVGASLQDCNFINSTILALHIASCSLGWVLCQGGSAFAGFIIGGPAGAVILSLIAYFPCYIAVDKCIKWGECYICGITSSCFY